MARDLSDILGTLPKPTRKSAGQQLEDLLAAETARAAKRRKEKTCLPDHLKARRWINLAQVMELTTLSRASIYRKSADPGDLFPEQVQPSDRRAAWPEAEILEWMDDHEDERG